MHRVSGPDAAFLYGETRSWHMHVSSILMADPSTAAHGFTEVTHTVEVFGTCSTCAVG